MIGEQRFIQADLVGVIYDLPEVGDAIPFHVHDEGTEHLTIVTSGVMAVTVIHPDGSHVTTDYYPNAIINFPKDVPHEIRAKEPGRVVNVMTHTVFNQPKAFHTRNDDGTVTHHCKTTPYDVQEQEAQGS